MNDGAYRWLVSFGDERMFLPELDRSRALNYLQYLSIERAMGWKLVIEQDGVVLTRINPH